MKHKYTILLLLMLTQCSENESENIVLPTLSKIKVSVLVDGPQTNTIEFEGEFIEGQYPIQDVKIVWERSAGFDIEPSTYLYKKSADLISENTFKVSITIDDEDHYHLAFYFDSDTMATYSEAYGYSPFNNSLTKIYP